MSDNQGQETQSRLATVGLSVLGAVVALAVWWGSVEVFHVRSLFVPSPPEVVEEFLELPGYLMKQVWVTLTEVVVGFALAIVVGVALGVTLASSRVLKQMFYPLLVGLNSVPKLAFGTLFILWMGFGATPKIVMALVLCFFQIVISTAYGLTSTPVEFVDYARSLGTPRWRVFVKVRFPYAMPQVFVGLKSAITLAVTGAAVGELLGSSDGLGFIIVSAGATSNTALAFVGIILLALMGAVLFLAVAAVERVALPWAREISSAP